MLYIPGKIVETASGRVTVSRCYKSISPPEVYLSARGNGQPGSQIAKYSNEMFIPCTEDNDADSSDIPS